MIYKKIVIGDSPFDIEAGLANGAIAIGVATGKASKENLMSHGANLVIENLNDQNWMKDIKEKIRNLTSRST